MAKGKGKGGNTWTMCEFHESTCNGFGDIWWTDNPIYFSSIDVIVASERMGQTVRDRPLLFTTYFSVQYPLANHRGSGLRRRMLFAT